MSRYRINAKLVVELDAEDGSEAYEAFINALDRIEGMYDFSISHIEQSEVPYACPATGVERWLPTARRIRFAEDRAAIGMHDGSWWWSDNYAALRCTGEPPPDMRRVSLDEFARAIGVAQVRERTEIEWSSPFKEGAQRVRRCTSNERLGIQEKYHRLISQGVPDAVWRAASDLDEIHVADRAGQLMAVLMPFRLEPSRRSEP